ncbi:HNH endonuclease [Carnobacteriaceae bacterium zg-ZUI252]|nr:HNH endonuclease [Carnobacteriaceae bacterium zg-ZUI252]
MLKPCRNIRCKNLTNKGYCDNCKYTKDKIRPSANKRGYNALWRKNSKAYLQANPLCVECAKEGKIVVADCVDHIIAHKGDMKLFWDVNNWQSLCNSCHSRKTINEDMGGWY